MNKFQIDLIKRALKNYRETSESETTFNPKSSDEWYYYSSAVEYLSEAGYIEVLDDSNLEQASVFSMQLRYALTDKGFDYAKSHLED